MCPHLRRTAGSEAGVVVLGGLLRVAPSSTIPSSEDLLEEGAASSGCSPSSGSPLSIALSAAMDMPVTDRVWYIS